MDEEVGKAKNRHGCLTAWLIIMIVANSITALTYLFLNSLLRPSYPDSPVWFFYLLAGLGACNIVFAVFLLRWKKWAFWSCLGTTICAFAMNLLMKVNILSSVLGLAGILILFGALNIGKENKGWPQLE